MEGDSASTFVNSWLNGFKLLSGTLLRGIPKDGKEVKGDKVTGVDDGTLVKPGNLSRDGEDGVVVVVVLVFTTFVDPNLGEGSREFNLAKELAICDS